MSGACFRPFRIELEQRARRPLPDTRGPTGVSDDVRAAVAWSLARFQIGEAGEGRIAHDIDRFHGAGVDDDYRRALKLFVAEEGRHGRILGELVRALDGALVTASWTERLFVVGRRLVGIRLKLVVLLAAEVVGVVFYRALASRLQEGTVRAALLEICGDEDRHLEFHAAFFRVAAPSGWRRALFVLVWAAVATAASGVVLADHQRTLRVLGVSLVDVARALGAQIRRAASGVAQTEAAAQLAGRGA